MTMAVRNILRLRDVEQVTGNKKSQIYAQMAKLVPSRSAPTVSDGSKTKSKTGKVI
jgi:hypothetical protein